MRRSLVHQAWPILTALPTTPVDGQEIYYRADVTTGTLWHLRYNLGSGSAYKWEFVGGSDLGAQAGGPGAPAAANAWTDLSDVVGPQVTAPLAGDYRVAWNGMSLYTGTAAWQIAYCGPAVGATGNAGDYGASMIINTNSLNGVGNVGGETRVLSVPAGSLLRLRYYVSVIAAMSFYNRGIYVRPVRVG